MDVAATWEQVCERAARFANNRGGSLRQAERFIARCGHMTFGVEYCSVADREMAYLNVGHTYAATVIKEGGECEVSSLGDWAEEAKKAYCEDEGVIQCPSCSRFTPVDSRSYHLTVCEHCGEAYC